MAWWLSIIYDWIVACRNYMGKDSWSSEKQQHVTVCSLCQIASIINMRFNALSKCRTKTIAKRAIQSHWRRANAIPSHTLYSPLVCHALDRSSRLFACSYFVSWTVLYLYCFHSSFAIIAFGRNTFSFVFNRQMFVCRLEQSSVIMHSH